MAGWGFNILDIVPAIVGAAVVAAVLLAVRASGFLPEPRRRRFRVARLRSSREIYADPADIGQQLHAVMAASFTRRRLLSSSEYQVFRIVEEELAAGHGQYRPFAQTNLGEVLASPEDNAFRAINSKRVDILVVDKDSLPVLAIEYQGEGHYQGTAAARDAIKKEALRKAGVRYCEVLRSDTAEQIRSRVRDHLAIN